MNLTGYTFNAEQGVVIGKRGKPVGRLDTHGYVAVSDGGHTYRAHRMIWQHVHGPIPAGMEINHKNGIKTDNRIENLELTTRGHHNSHHNHDRGRNHEGRFMGKSRSGRMLDGVEHNEFPESA